MSTLRSAVGAVVPGLTGSSEPRALGKKEFEDPQGEQSIVAALRAGDERAFQTLFETLAPSMLRVARLIVSNPWTAEEVVQDTWLGVLRGVTRFEGRSALRTWIFSILINRARTRAKRDRRSIAFSSLMDPAAAESSREVQRFSEEDPSRMWPLTVSKENPEDRFLSQEALDLVLQTLQTIPRGQAEVVTLRDFEGWSSKEICAALRLSEANQKVLLHRGRKKIRRALALYLSPGSAALRAENR